LPPHIRAKDSAAPAVVIGKILTVLLSSSKASAIASSTW
jgi:hypothetical protein